jgi:hypothetical protein
LFKDRINTVVLLYSIVADCIVQKFDPAEFRSPRLSQSLVIRVAGGRMTEEGEEGEEEDEQEAVEGKGEEGEKKSLKEKLQAMQDIVLTIQVM